MTTRGLIAKVADFGLARSVQGELYEVHSNVAFRWAPPEVLTTHKHYAGSDVWSFGVTVWEIYGKGATLPYAELDTNEDVVDFVCQQREVLAKPTLCPAAVWSKVLPCFAYEHAARPSFSALVSILSA